MCNYEHEIPRLKDKFMHNFLWVSYFHDAEIKEIRIENNGNDIFIVLECHRDGLEYKNWNNYIHIDASSDNKNYDYEMHFSDCRYFASSLPKHCNYSAYLYCIFKNSALLKRISKLNKKKLYHARMEFNTGYFDVIFNKFTVTKKQGTLVIRKNFQYINHFDSVKKTFATFDLAKVLYLAKKGEDPEKSEALEYLWILRHPKCKNTAIEALNDEYAWIPAIFILGEIGDISDISLLQKKVSDFDEYVPKYREMALLHINDALEKIFYRA